MASDKTETEKAAKVEPKATKAEAREHEAFTTLEAREIGDPVEAAIAEAVGRRLMCGHEGARIVPGEGTEEYARLLGKTVKAAVEAYRGGKE